MPYSTWSGYYTPSTKKELIEVILPHWNGTKTELNQYKTKRLKAIFHTMRRKNMNKLMGVKNDV